MSNIEAHLCATCGNDHCSYGGYGPIVADGDDRNRLCEHWEPITDLQAENAELRKERDALDHLTDVLNATNDGLIAENAKMRELVRDIADHIKHDDGFGIDRGWVLDRIRELGIEVDA